jgi:two-component system response regulator HydG
MARKMRILVVDDVPDILRVTDEVLSDAGFSVATASDGKQALEAIGKEFFDLLILDERMPGLTGAQVLAEARRIHPDLGAIMVTAYASLDLAVRVFREGANDLLTKPATSEQLLAAVERALEHTRLARELRYLRSRGRLAGRFGGLVGQSEKLRAVLRQAERALDSAVPVLITGETGTGKELVARGLHQGGPRADGPFVVTNLNAIPDGLLESELFGHVKGAFTGADAHRSGKFEIAHKGTIFLDEIGDISLSTQVKLLRVLQDKVVQRVGGNDQIDVDVRIVAATNKDLKKEVEAGRFRQDLYYRLAVFPLELPALRDRKEDIPLLAEHFRSLYAAECGKAVADVTPQAIELLMRYDWPGNVRELEHVIHRAVLLTDGSTIEPEALSGVVGGISGGSLPAEWTKGTLEELLDRVEKTYLERLLAESSDNLDEMARRADIHRTTLARKLDKHGLRSAKA